MMKRQATAGWWLPAIFVGVVWAWVPSELWGQFQASTVQGSFGSRTLGGTISGGGRNAFGGTGALGGAGSPVGGTAGSRLDQLGSTAQITGSERFLRENRQAGSFVGGDGTETSFVGAVGSGTAAGGLGMGGLGTTGLGGARGLSTGGFGTAGFGTTGRGTAGGRGAMGARGNQLGGAARTVNLQTQLLVGFAYQQIPQTKVEQNLKTHLSIEKLPRFSGVRIALEDRVVTLRGSVASEEDRRLAVQMARLEPGVSDVRDELTVGDEQRTSPTTPAP